MENSEIIPQNKIEINKNKEKVMSPKEILLDENRFEVVDKKIITLRKLIEDIKVDKNLTEKQKGILMEKINRAVVILLNYKEGVKEIIADYAVEKRQITTVAKIKINTFLKEHIEVAKYKVIVNGNESFENNFEIYKKEGKFILEMNGTGIFKDDTVSFEKPPTKEEIVSAVNSMVLKYTNKHKESKVELISKINESAIQNPNNNTTTPGGIRGDSGTKIPESSNGMSYDKNNGILGDDKIFNYVEHNSN